jgi:hypothetical protein
MGPGHSRPRFTILDAKTELKALGLTITKTDHGEFRVNFIGGKEATAYYATDLDDAMITGKHMAQKEITSDDEIKAFVKKVGLKRLVRVLQLPIDLNQARAMDASWDHWTEKDVTF